MLGVTETALTYTLIKPSAIRFVCIWETLAITAASPVIIVTLFSSYPSGVVIGIFIAVEYLFTPAGTEMLSDASKVSKIISLFISYFQFFKFGSFLEVSPSFASRQKDRLSPA